jgi:hypothetical protein
MDDQREQERQTYELCRLGFGFLSFALILASASTVISLLAFFLQLQFHQVDLRWILQSPLWRWLDAPIIWGSLMGAYLLWGRWNDVGWQRRSGLLVVMSMVDVVLWLMQHSEALGLGLTDGGRNWLTGSEWLRSQVGEALGWAEFALMASLACDFLAHLGVEQAPEAGKATRSLAATGAVVWMLYFCDTATWDQWPLQPKGFNQHRILLQMGVQMIWTITLIQVTALTIATTRQSSQVLAEIDREAQDDSLLRSPSDADEAILAAQADDFSTGSDQRY